MLLLFLRNFLWVIERFRVAYGTANVNLYHVTVSWTFLYFYKKLSSFTFFSSIRIALHCFYLFMFYFEKFSTWVCRLPKCIIEDFFRSRTLRKYFHFSLLVLLLQITCHIVSRCIHTGKVTKNTSTIKKNKTTVLLCVADAALFSRQPFSADT